MEERNENIKVGQLRWIYAVEVTCGGCGRSRIMSRANLIRRGAVPEMTLVELWPRLRCEECRHRGASVSLIERDIEPHRPLKGAENDP